MAGGTKIKSMFHPVNLPVQGRENRQPGRDSQDRHNTAWILCLRLGASLISLGRLNPLHRSREAPSNFCFTFFFFFLRIYIPVTTHRETPVVPYERTHLSKLRRHS